MRFEIVQGDEQLSSHSGLALAGAILDRSQYSEAIRYGDATRASISGDQPR